VNLIDENFVVRAAAAFFEGQGFVIEARLTTSEMGVDIRAKHPGRGEIWLVEAKGQTSSKQHSRRHGKRFTSSQVRVHVAMAFCTACALRQAHVDDNTVHVGVALPDDEAHRKRIAAIGQLMGMVGIEILWVSASGQVRLAQATAE
jgi:hypothetical protein